MKLLFVTSEYHPWAKAGGLADAVASLAEALAARGHDVTCVLPRYESIQVHGLEDVGISLGVPLGRREEWTAVYAARSRDVRLYFIEHEELFGRPGIYGPNGGEGFSDNARRFALLSRGALQLALALDLRPDVVHAHDWPTALVPVYRSLYSGLPAVARARYVFSIHNLGYQGIFAPHEAEEFGLPGDDLALVRRTDDGPVNLLRGAVLSADRVVTVSPQYALEIQQPEHGFGLHRIIQARAGIVSGILNGIDTEEWNPAHDPLIAAPFDAQDLAGKWRSKRRLQHDLGLPVEARTPLVGMVTRLAEQKGVHALFAPGRSAVRRICEQLPVQFVLLGSGDPALEEEVRRLSAQLPNFSAVIGYNEHLAHLIQAGCDFLLMPSLYEPCGLNQMYAMRYGTVPIVTRTGGLANTVDSDTGYFIEEHSAANIVLTVERAVQDYREDPARIDAMRRAGMERDFSWSRSATEYERLYTADSP